MLMECLFFNINLGECHEIFLAVYSKSCSDLVVVLAGGCHRQYWGPFYEFFNSVKGCFFFLSALGFTLTTDTHSGQVKSHIHHLHFCSSFNKFCVLN
jgi:hypothetical protein